MLPALNRLKKPRDISRVFKQGRYAASPELMVRVAANSQPDSRLVVVISKKVSKKAVVRNRLRRQIIGIVQRGWQTVAAGYDIVVTVRADLSPKTAPQLEQLVTAALEKAGVTKVSNQSKTK